MYAFKTGFHCRVPCDVVCERIEALKAKHGVCRPRDLIADAKPRTSPIHDAFPPYMWNDREAAERHREAKARELIHSIVWIETDPATGEKITEIAYASVATPYTKSQGYISLREAMAEPTTREIVLEQALAALRGWQTRWGHLNAAANKHVSMALAALTPKKREEKGKAVAKRQDKIPAETH